MKCKKNGVMKTMVMVLAILCVLSMAGCAQEKEPPKIYEDASENLEVDWDAVTENLRNADLSGTGFYLDEAGFEEEIREFSSVTFTNYEPAVPHSFKDVENQIMVLYGLVSKNEYADEAPEFYDGAVFEIYIFNNATREYYDGVYSADKKLLSEDGTWILDADKEETISAYIDICTAAMGV